MEVGSSILAVLVLTILGFSVLKIRTVLLYASKRPEKIINEKFMRQWGYLLEGMRPVGDHT